MVLVRALALSLLCSLGVAGPASATVLWRGDFETSDLSQYDNYVVHAERWTFVGSQPSPRQGLVAARVELQENDVGPSNLIRTEVGHTPPEATFQGSERYYAWSAMGSTDHPLGNFDHQIMFWECVAPIYQQEMSLHINGTQISFATSPQGGRYQTRWTGTFDFGVWHDFVLHVKWSLDPAEGFVELLYDGAVVVPKTFVRTMHAVQDGSGNDVTPLVSTMHHGLFLGNARAGKPVEVIYLDGAIEGETLADVLPVMPDAGVVADAAPADLGVQPLDAGVEEDAGSLPDGGGALDGGVIPADAGAAPPDAGATALDAGGSPSVDAGVDAGPPGGGGAGALHGSCGCTSTSTSTAPLILPVLLVAWAWRRRSSSRAHHGSG